MTIEYYHASKYGNGAMVADAFKRHMSEKGITVNVHHIRDVRPREIPPADLYIFSSPGRIGRPLGSVRRFLARTQLPAGTNYAILATQVAPQPDKKTGQMPSEAEMAKWQRIIPIMNDILQKKGYIGVAADAVLVTGIKGPLEAGWQDKVAAFADRIPVR